VIPKQYPLLTLLGPTASGKTSLAVRVAQQIDGAIISADSRQIYKGMDIGTGKDLKEYLQIPYYGIDMITPGSPYHVAQFRKDVEGYLEKIHQSNKRPILCGGTGLYLKAILQGLPYSDVPVNRSLRLELEALNDDQLYDRAVKTIIPEDFKADWSTRKRTIRAIELATWLQNNPFQPKQHAIESLTFGLNPPVETRRLYINQRLEKRLEEGLIEEVQQLLDHGLSEDQLIFYGLEYKYTTLYLQGIYTFDQFKSKLTTEIHRFAKRQMTFFRYMEKEGLVIHWLKSNQQEDQLEEIRTYLNQAI
jgi:tRNA dimethylallyltransferase